MVIAVKLADVGLGAVISAILGFCGLFFLDQRRRTWEKDNRFQEQKRQAYKTFLRLNDLLVSDLRLVTAFSLVIRRWEAEEKNADQGRDDVEVSRGELAEGKLLIVRLEANVAKYHEHLFDAVTDLQLLAPTSGILALSMAEPLEKMAKALSGGESEEFADLEREYQQARREFEEHARRDLGVTQG
jgi:hypothetical protein